MPAASISKKLKLEEYEDRDMEDLLLDSFYSFDNISMDVTPKGESFLSIS